MKPTYSNDRKAPRMRKGEFSKMVVTKELYEKFIKEFPEYKDMGWRVFYQNWLDITESIRHEVINNPLGVRLGSHTGELKLQFLPYKFKATDHGGTEKEGEHLEYLQIETRGKTAKIKWERRWAVKFNKILQFYAFDETRELNKMAATYVPENSDKLRVARVTLGGHSVWRQKIKST